jgi:hypothetical protein
VLTFDMPARKPKTYKLDETLIQALEKLAESVGQSAGSYVEQVLWKHCQGAGFIPVAANPPKDQRGGKRSGAGRPKATLSDAAQGNARSEFPDTDGDAQD